MRAVLLLQCPDQPGIVAAVGAFVAEAGGNIIEADQHSDPVAGLFLQRIEFDVDAERAALAARFEPIAQRFSMDWALHDCGVRARVAILASRQGHCLGDLLVRFALGEMPGEVALVASNHDMNSELVARQGYKLDVVPVGDDRAAQEQALGRLLDRANPDLVVLARYMLVLPEWLVDAWAGRMVNIHHSFLPSFAGARPYAQAHERGVKVIGATAHYVTPALDEGPIIAQQVMPVSHRDDPARLERRGRDLEAVVLAEAVRLHLEHRVIVYGRRTAVFD
ncbi:MAG TPA: formyltetrahydrofolate deformylase [Acidimicrobiia bacterium]|nr:formyltetrahydrofolate deformylase [Acidimicrobiia bacterium]